jgi:hypothetical protein
VWCDAAIGAVGAVGAGAEAWAVVSADQGCAPTAASASWAIASFSYRKSTGLPAAMATAVLSADRGPSAIERHWRAGGITYRLRDGQIVEVEAAASTLVSSSTISADRGPEAPPS